MSYIKYIRDKEINKNIDTVKSFLEKNGFIPSNNDAMRFMLGYKTNSRGTMKKRWNSLIKKYKNEK